LIGVDGWADGLGGEGPATKARINDFHQILDFASKYAQALKPSLLKALAQYPTTIVATHVPPYEGAAWHQGLPSSPDYQPFFSSPTMGKLITAGAAGHPGKNIVVLCGHTHSSGTFPLSGIRETSSREFAKHHGGIGQGKKPAHQMVNMKPKIAYRNLATCSSTNLNLKIRRCERGKTGR